MSHRLVEDPHKTEGTVCVCTWRSNTSTRRTCRPHAGKAGSGWRGGVRIQRRQCSLGAPPCHPTAAPVPEELQGEENQIPPPNTELGFFRQNNKNGSQENFDSVSQLPSEVRFLPGPLISEPTSYTFVLKEINTWVGGGGGGHQSELRPQQVRLQLRI